MAFATAFRPALRPFRTGWGRRDASSEVAAPAGSEGELLGFNDAGSLDNLSIATLLERLIASSPPSGETYTLEEV
jgi:hypothetical protein